MKRRLSVAGLGVLTACLAGWAALASAQPAPIAVPPGLEIPAAPFSAKPADPVAVSPVVTLKAAAPVAVPTPPSEPPSGVAPADGLPALPTVPAVPPLAAVPPIPPLAAVPPIPAPPAEPKPEPMEMRSAPVGGIVPVMPEETKTAAKPASVEKTDPALEQPVGRQEPGVSLEWVGSTVAKVGQPGEYSLVVRNLGHGRLQDVVVRVAIPAGLSVKETAPKAAEERGKLVWDLGTLGGKQQHVIQMRLQAEAKGDSLPQAWVTFTGSAVMRVSVREPKLAIKCSVADKVLVGDPATFTLVVTNPGDGSADQVKIRAAFSEGLEHARGNKIDFGIGNLAAGESRNVTLLCATRASGVQKCEAVVEAENGLSAKDAVSLTVLAPRLGLRLAGPRLRYIDRKAIYSLAVTNPGDAPASNVTVADVVPAGFKVLAASDGGRHDFRTRTVSWFLGEVGPGQTREVKLEVQALTVGEYQHKAAAVGARGLRAESELPTRVQGPAALLVDLVDTEDPIEAGGETGYEVRITNTGSKTETDLKLVAVVPDAMEFKNATGPARFRVEGKTVVFEPLENLAPRADAVFRINVKALTAGQCVFKVQVSSTNITDPIVKFESTRIYSDSGEPGAVAAPAGIAPAAPAAPAGGIPAPVTPAPSIPSPPMPAPGGILPPAPLPASGPLGKLPLLEGT